MKDLSYYMDCLHNLRTNRQKGHPAPHKPLLLLAIMDLVERGHIQDNKIELSDVLVRAFHINEKRFIGNSIIFKPNIGYPFYHMQSEPFWILRSKSEELFQRVVSEGSESYGEQRLETPSQKLSYSLKALKNQYSYAIIDKELFDLICDPDARAKMRTLLISEYLTRQPNNRLPIITVPIIVVAAIWIA